MTSPRQIERTVKKIVRKEIESQGRDETFFIDREVYDRHLPRTKENIDDSSLSDFLLKYDLKIPTPELVKYFSPNTSRKRNFANLVNLSSKYGCHLCYMALKESANEKNCNAELIEDMKQTALAMKKKPPSDLFLNDSPTSSEEDIPGGQGESEKTDDSNGDKSVHVPVAEIQNRMEDLVIKDTPQNDAVNPLYEPPNVDEPLSNDGFGIFSTNHTNTCQCSTCQRGRTGSDPGPKPNPGTSYVRSKSEATPFPNILEDEETASTKKLARYSKPQEASTVDNTSTSVGGDHIRDADNSGGYYQSPRESELSVKGKRSEPVH